MPGNFTFLDPETGDKRLSKFVIIAHSMKWEQHPNNDDVSRTNVTSRPRLGENVFAATRPPLPVPWKPNVVVTPLSRKQDKDEEE